ncbi:MULTISPECIES: ABC transporter permease [unclassified Fusibacter]|uniref:ABC transporter permease n=1 Tax=unclassified Fusibacter TaxID=2624464 RepID=UPI0010124B60|nr:MULTISPECIES: ABC transporter permease [unclassified Fusibacter]MCK8059568.1 ABC transporter permease [Fusibacter sp. A2]NPE21369.1 FtsX-like permease family protein [Fusibacter sp. A1]RXV61785.1 cell division protein FtsX [Fusibacter sp. A1]
MNILESIKIALSAIWVNKMRSLLTMLGIIIGISSVITIVSLGNGMEEAMNEEFAKLGINRVMITHNWEESVDSRDYMTTDDAEAIQRVFSEEFATIQPMFSGNGSVEVASGKKKTASVNINGAGENFRELQAVEIIKGRFINEDDIASDRMVIVIDDALAMKVFGTTDVLGETMEIDIYGLSNQFSIVGIAKPQTGFMGMGNEMSETYIPLYTAQKILGYGDYIWSIEGAAKLSGDTDKMLEKVIDFLERRHNSVGSDKYRAYNMENEMSMITGVLTGVTAVISAIAAVSLLVGGIGVMNIMLVSVTERTREIGIRKALGAKYKEIMYQFLIEAVIISSIGGMIGTLIGIGLSKLIAAVVPFLPGANASLTSILVAWAFSAGVGVIFGIFPASKAAKLNPIDALRYE